ncbi:3-dehydroquinate synthase [Sphingobium sp. CCH11-B1]|jgi:3-dehydroquinate synthase|uniref:3-dehydroquinate synthase n=1 Tax=Sphingobium sp. CCH11-B1 TaxID=1768781 RepID=UPI0008330CE2|nr:3-dehydroquinate synthase [Sphingobium sp. CCH11-B1]MEA3389676.1 3-dehydroquinate synthase [Pseudomonadota bacterium]
MALVRVALDARSYDIVIEQGALDRAGDLLSRHARKGRLVVVTDTHVAAAQLPRLDAALRASDVTVEPIILPAGEQTKSWRHLEQLLDALLALEIERGDHVVALGGGVIGDLVGFAASILKRGCHFIQLPTTLLAQVDSSVGGKTAINTRAGKNLVGSFYQPALVLIDPSTLDSLPPRETRAGYAEVVKYGLIDDPDFFAWCESDGHRLLAGDAQARVHAIERSVRAKAAIVADDERETSGRRALLNLGHTFGHALEADTGFSDTLLHGEGVAAGMALAFRYSARLGLCPQEDADRVTAHLKAVGLPYDLATAHVTANGPALVAHMLHDKKMAAGTLPFLLARGIGQTFLSKDVALDDVAAFLDEDRAKAQRGATL